MSSCAVGVILCSFYQFIDKILCHHDNYKYEVCGYDTTLFIGQQHPITVYRTGSWVCVVLVLSVICVPLANPLKKLYFIMIIQLLCIISYETTFSHSFLFGLGCIFQLPGSGICILYGGNVCDVCSCAVGVILCSFYQFIDQVYFITIVINTKSVGTTRHCSLVSSTPSQSIGLVFGCALFWC